MSIQPTTVKTTYVRDAFGTGVEPELFTLVGIFFLVCLIYCVGNYLRENGKLKSIFLNNRLGLLIVGASIGFLTVVVSVSPLLGFSSPAWKCYFASSIAGALLAMLKPKQATN